MLRQKNTDTFGEYKMVNNIIISSFFSEIERIPMQFFASGFFYLTGNRMIKKTTAQYGERKDIK